MDRQTGGREGKKKGEESRKEWGDRWTNGRQKKERGTGIGGERKGGVKERRKNGWLAFKSCTLVLLIQVSEVLSQDILLSTEGPAQTSIPHIVGDIREVSMEPTLLATAIKKYFFRKALTSFPASSLTESWAGSGSKASIEHLLVVGKWLLRNCSLMTKQQVLDKLLLLQLLLLSYRLEHTYFNLSPDLGVKVQLIRVAAHAMLLLLAIQLDFDTEQRYTLTRKTSHIWEFENEPILTYQNSGPVFPRPLLNLLLFYTPSEGKMSRGLVRGPSLPYHVRVATWLSPSQLCLSVLFSEHFLRMKQCFAGRLTHIKRFASNCLFCQTLLL